LPPVTSVPLPVTSPPEPPVIALASPSAVAGGEATIRGRGCPHNVPVVVTIDGREVGRSVASGHGEFETRLDLRDVDVGRRVVLARCGSITLQSTVDVVINTTAPAAGPAAIVSMLALFGIIGMIFLLVRNSDQPVLRSDRQEESEA